MTDRLKRILDKLFSTSAAGLYMLIFAIAIGAATFIENDFGTSSAQKVVFRAWWFELLLLLFGISIIVNIFRFRMIQLKKWPLLMFHSAIIVILIGSAVTRYFGYEGIMHIREGSASDYILSNDTYLQFEAEYQGKTYRFDEEVYFATLGRNHFEESYQLGGKVFDIRLDQFVPNPTQELVSSDNGVPILKVVIAGSRGREEYFLKQGDRKLISGTWYNFANDPMTSAVNFAFRDNALLVMSPSTLSVMQMATQKQDTLYPGSYEPLLVRSLYSNDEISFVIGDFRARGDVVATSSSPKMRNESIAGLYFTISTEDGSARTVAYGNKGMEGRPAVATIGDLRLAIRYGAKRIPIPFSIALRDFIMERYPGTNSASSYASEVTLIDPPAGVHRDERIFMNNILNYRGFRFFQSSYDRDELGTVLSVNHDFWGTWISYLGYALLTIGMIWTLFSKKSRFNTLARALRKKRVKERLAPATAVLIGLCMSVLPADGYANADAVVKHSLPLVSMSHAEQFSRLIVQDHKGRMKPVHTMSSEVLRKVARKEELYGQTADQVFLGMTIYPQQWASVPLIKIGRHEELHRILGVEGELASFDDFFTEDGKYLLKDEVRRAHSLESIDRTKFDKEVIKVDERVNICNLVFAGRLMKIYPILNDPSNTWLSPADVVHRHAGAAADGFTEKFFPAYAPTVREAVQTDDWQLANALVEELKGYQENNGGEVLISDSKINTEIWLNEVRIFNRLGKYYALLGLAFLVVFFTRVFKENWNMRWPRHVLLGLLVAAFLAHTLGLAARWYVSGHAPWSNGYESMIYIAWTTILAGLIFARKASGGLAATCILSSTILMVAGLNWLDPEITPLVPVLKSYWLMIHVSLEAGSYGFLMLGAIIGVLNLILMSLITDASKIRIQRTVREMTQISEMTLIGGLFMISIGTYLGGVWANESWGRYWGWDAKETWALVTILVYAFILHMRFIPGLRGPLAFNVASLFGFASVMMTYFGVNYYLSGLHSYAAGDPVPIPPAVYYTAAILTAVSLLAYARYRPYLRK